MGGSHSPYAHTSSTVDGKTFLFSLILCNFLLVTQFCGTILWYNYYMVLDRGIEFEDSAGKHGYTLDDVLYAVKNPVAHDMYKQNGYYVVRLIGHHHGDPLVPYIEVIYRQGRDGRIHVFHVNALQGGFLD